MAITNMIPKVWASRIIEKLEKSLVYGQPGVSNTAFQGEISQFGDQVHVHSFNDVSIVDYTRNVTTLNYEVLTDSRVTLTIDQSKAFAVKVDDLDAAQMHPEILDNVANRAAYQLAEVADRHLASRYTEADAGNVITSTQFTIANVYSKFVDLSRRMDEALVPATGRFAVIPPWIKALLLENSEFLAAQSSAVLNGEVGQIAGIRLLVSTNVPVTGTTTLVNHVMSGTSDALSFAQQISAVEGLRLEGSFADALRGLHLYGSKVLRPELLFDLRAQV